MKLMMLKCCGVMLCVSCSVKVVWGLGFVVWVCFSSVC